jgi:hypothetical protein
MQSIVPRQSFSSISRYSLSFCQRNPTELYHHKNNYDQSLSLFSGNEGAGHFVHLWHLIRSTAEQVCEEIIGRHFWIPADQLSSSSQIDNCLNLAGILLVSTVPFEAIGRCISYREFGQDHPAAKDENYGWKRPFAFRRASEIEERLLLATIHSLLERF